MANINPLSQKYFISYAQELKSKFQRLKELTDHPNASGDYHEEILRNILRNFLTDRFSVKTGFIYKDKEHVSKQIDILIIDETAPAAYLFKDGQFAIVVPEAVVATIEVKTTLREDQFLEGIENIKSVKELFEFSNSISSFIFGYAGTKAQDDVLTRWFTNLEDASETRLPDGFMFFNAAKLLLRWGSNFKNGANYRKLYLKGASIDETLGWQLSVFVAAIVSSCEYRQSHQGATIQLGGESVANRLMQAEFGEVSEDSFLFSKGHIPGQDV